MRLSFPGMRALALMAGLGLTAAQAQPLGDQAEAIRQLLDSARGPEAVVAARRFLRQVTDEAGFGVTNAQLTVGPAEGFGMFEPRRDNIFRRDEQVLAYDEVYWLSMQRLATGANRLLFDVYFTLDTPDGQAVTPSMIPMGEVMMDSHSEPVDGFFHLTYRVTGAEGPYTLRTRVVDRASGQRAEFSLPVEFRPNGDAAPGSK